MGLLKDLLYLIRPNQWYKNLVIFLAIIFSRNFLNLSYLNITLFGFFILILISSSNYILNDIIDADKDRVNPEKRSRPIASRRVRPIQAFILFLVFLFIGLLLALNQNKEFFWCAAGVFLISTLYSLWLKKVLFADILAISSNFVLRAVAGAVLIGVYISPWLVIGVFFFALFLVTGKRYGELAYLSKDAAAHRKVLNYYSKDLIFNMLNIFTSLFILTFALYTFSSEHKNLIVTTPLFIYLILRYYYLILTGNEISRHPHKVIKDIPLIIGSILYLIISLGLIIIK